MEKRFYLVLEFEVLTEDEEEERVGQEDLWVVEDKMKAIVMVREVLHHDYYLMKNKISFSWVLIIAL